MRVASRTKERAGYAFRKNQRNLVGLIERLTRGTGDVFPSLPSLDTNDQRYFVLYGRSIRPVTFDVYISDAVRREAAGGEVVQRVARTELPGGGVVSTVFLGINHQFYPGRPPLVFETMVFVGDGSRGDVEQRRYSTWEEAEAGHAEIVRTHLPAAQSVQSLRIIK